MAAVVNHKVDLTRQQELLVHRQIIIDTHLQTHQNCRVKRIQEFTAWVHDPVNAPALPPNTTATQFLLPVRRAIGQKTVWINGMDLGNHLSMDSEVVKHAKSVTLVCSVYWNLDHRSGTVWPRYREAADCRLLSFFRQFRSCERLELSYASVLASRLAVPGPPNATPVSVVLEGNYGKLAALLCASVMGFDLHGNLVGQPRLNPTPLSKLSLYLTDSEVTTVVHPAYIAVQNGPQGQPGWSPNGNGWDNSAIPAGHALAPQWYCLERYFQGSYNPAQVPQVNASQHFPLSVKVVRAFIHGNSYIHFSRPGYNL